MFFNGITELDIINGISVSIFVIISAIVGIKLILKYFTHKIKEFVTVGFSLIFAFTHWWGNSFSFLLYLLFDYEMNLFIHLLIENIFMPIALLLWVYSFFSLIYPRYVKYAISIFLPLCVIEGIFILAVLIINPQIFGSMLGLFDTKSSVILLGLKISNALIFGTTGVLYSLKLISNVDKMIKLKGKLFIIGIISFLVGSISLMFFFDLLVMFFFRLVLLSSSIAIYLSFLLPERVAKRLIKEE